MPLLEAYCFGQTRVNMSSKDIKSGFVGSSFQALQLGRETFTKRKVKSQKSSYCPSRTQRTKRSEVLLGARSLPRKKRTPHALVVEPTTVVEDQ